MPVCIKGIREAKYRCKSNEISSNKRRNLKKKFKWVKKSMKIGNKNKMS